MPDALKTACFCGTLDCVKHRAAEKRSAQLADQARKDDPARAIYRTQRWKRTRAFILTRDLLCVAGVKAIEKNEPEAALCVARYGIPMPSTDADHVISIRAGGDPWDHNNLQGLCHEDHARKTQLERNLNATQT
jgi:5-methylcytosine-specific restriction endonuclease McrA